MGNVAIKDDDQDLLVDLSGDPVSDKESVAPGEELNFALAVDRSDFGSSDSLRYIVLTWVLDENYDRAIQKIKDFMNEKSEYPDFKKKISRYISHSIDLIYAIRAKRSFPGISSLTRAKQQELRDKFKDHFQELKYSLKKVEKIKTDLRVEDARSTIYIVKALVLAVASLTVFAFIMEINNGLARTSHIVFGEILDKITDFFAKILSL